jgi:hypothetical protein
VRQLRQSPLGDWHWSGARTRSKKPDAEREKGFDLYDPFSKKNAACDLDLVGPMSFGA